MSAIFDRINSNVNLGFGEKSYIKTYLDCEELYGEENLTKAFLIYQFPKEIIDSENPKNLFRKIVVDPNQKVYTLHSVNTEQYIYGISALNRLHQESEIILVNP